MTLLSKNELRITLPSNNELRITLLSKNELRITIYIFHIHIPYIMYVMERGQQGEGTTTKKQNHNNNNNNNNTVLVPRGGGESHFPVIPPRALRDGRKGDPLHKCCGKNINFEYFQKMSKSVRFDFLVVENDFGKILRWL